MGDAIDSDISRWVQLAVAPREDLSTELKSWLDLRNEEHRANLAQSLLALANHGGGTVLVGYDDKTRAEVAEAPTALHTFTTDKVNDVVKKFADPPFHCHLHIIEDPRLKHPHPVIVVPGNHRVPIRALRAGPGDKHVKANTYYIRRPGPSSAPPASAAEWEQLIKRCVLNHRDDLHDALRAVLSGEPTRAPHQSRTLEEATRLWRDKCRERFAALVSEAGTAATYSLGTFDCTYAFAQDPAVDAKDLRETLRSVERQTGWPVWIFLNPSELAPYAFEGLIECFLARESGGDPGHADFWRASPEGKFFLLRGFQEDESDGLRGKVIPGKMLDRVLPVWRVGECLLHAARVAKRLAIESTPTHFIFSWSGLAGRQMVSATDGWGLEPGAASRQASVTSEFTVDADRIRLQLTDLVHKTVAPLHQAFGFEELARATVHQQLASMLQRTGGA